MNFINQMITAIYRFRKYPQLVNMKLSKVLGYIIIFTAMISVINFAPLVIEYKKIGGVEGIVNKYVPEFTIDNGKLSCDPIDFDDELMSVKIVIDCNEQVTETNIAETDVAGYSTYLLADSDKMVIGNALQKEVFAFSQLKGTTINKLSIVNFFNARKVKIALAAVFAITVLMSLVISTMFSLMFICALGAFINVLFIKANIGFEGLFKLSAYVRTFPSIVVLILGFAGVTGGTLLYWGLIVTYIYLALKNIKKQEAIIIAEIQ